MTDSVCAMLLSQLQVGKALPNDASQKGVAKEGETVEETVEIVGACKLMDGFFLGDAICAEVKDCIKTLIGLRFPSSEQDNPRC